MSFAEALAAKRENLSVAREIVVDEHAVAWVRYRFDHADGQVVTGHTLMCSCDVTPVGEGHVGGRTSDDGGQTWYADGHRCRFRRAAQLLIALEVRAELEQQFADGARPRQIEGNLTYAFDPDLFEQMILELMRWALDEQRWIGQHDSSTLYFQQIGAVLDAPDQVMAETCTLLFAERKIGLTGAMVSWFDERFEPRDDDDRDLDDLVPPSGETVSGTLHFYSETGTEGGHWTFQRDGEPGYAGLHVLQTGDFVQTEGFGGFIRLRHYPLFTESANGMWIHADQRGVPRERWAEMFFAGQPATLIRR